MLKRLTKWGQPLLVLLLWVSTPAPQTKEGTNPNIILAQNNNSQSLCPNQLASEIEKIVQRPEFVRSHWGILIQTLDSDLTLYALNSEQYFVPASNVKLFTTAAALLEFGSQFQIHTPIYTQGSPPVLDNLRIVGQGDPTLTIDKLKELARQLKQQGIQRIEKLTLQDGYFNNSGIPPMWEWDDLFFSYGVPAHSFVLNENAFDLTLTPGQVGQPLNLTWSDSIAARQWTIENLTTTTATQTEKSIEVKGIFAQPRLVIRGELNSNASPLQETIAILDPAQYFLDILVQVLESEGITVIRKQIVLGNDRSPDILMERGEENQITSFISPSLDVIIQKINHESNNLYAETLFKLLEVQASSMPKRLTQLGIDVNSYRIVDGSGLSRHNLATPAALVALLQKMSQTPQGKVYRNSLAIGGINGTLANRFKDTPVQGHLQAKTGSLSGISALSGYLDTSSGETLVFSIIVNTSEQETSSLRQGIDRIVLLLGQSRKCS